MRIETLRFGTVDVDDTRIINFPQGLLGFPASRRYALIQTAPDPAFYWLQSVDEPTLAFVVCDPLMFVPEYRVPIRRDDLDALEIPDLSDGQVLVIVNKVDGHLTANLLGPLVIGTTSKLGKQMVLSDKRYSTRHTLLPAAPARAAAMTA